MNETHKILWDFEIRTDHQISARRPDQVIVKKKKKKKTRTWSIVKFAVPADQRVNLKESEKNDKYLDLTRELKELLNMKVMVIATVIGALGTVNKGLIMGLENLKIRGGVETIQTTALLRSARILSPEDLRRLTVIQDHQLKLV